MAQQFNQQSGKDQKFKTIDLIRVLDLKSENCVTLNNWSFEDVFGARTTGIYEQKLLEKNENSDIRKLGNQLKQGWKV